MSDYEIHVDLAISHLSEARLELAGLGLDQAAHRVADLIDELDHGTTEDEQ